MKKLFVLLAVAVFFGCNSSQAPASPGDTTPVTKTYTVYFNITVDVKSQSDSRGIQNANVTVLLGTCWQSVTNPIWQKTLSGVTNPTSCQAAFTSNIAYLTYQSTFFCPDLHVRAFVTAQGYQPDTLKYPAFEGTPGNTVPYRVAFTSYLKSL